MTQEIVVNLSQVPWTTHRGKYEIQVGLDGSQGPEPKASNLPDLKEAKVILDELSC